MERPHHKAVKSEQYIISPTSRLSLSKALNRNLTKQIGIIFKLLTHTMILYYYKATFYHKL